ncbi:MAG: hypothetical protein AAGA48_27895 [Myxococcota bacterium]
MQELPTLAQAEAVVLEGAHSRAVVHPIGATVLSWAPHGDRDVLWVAPGAQFVEGRAIRGGIPVCWPWFADSGTPAHGLVRKRRWNLLDQGTDEGAAWAEWEVEHRDDNWHFSLNIRIEAGHRLSVALTHQDRSGRACIVGGALHTYLQLDPTQASVRGLPSSGWDKLQNRSVAVTDPLPLMGPQDLVVPHRGSVTVEEGDRSLLIEGHHHHDVVVWNPGGASVSDLAPGDEHAFACVESAIAKPEVTVLPHGDVAFGLQIGVSKRKTPP